MRRPEELRSSQQEVVTHLYNHDEAMAVMRPGGGKTVSALTAIVELKRDKVIRHALIIAPKRVARIVWPDEIALWAHTQGLTYQVLAGSPRQRASQLSNAVEHDLTIIGLDVVPWLVEQLRDYPDEHPLFDLLVIDEASRLRDPTGTRAKALASIADRWRMIWGLSGTLRPSGPLDLFMPSRVVTRGKLWGRSFYQWQRKHFYATDFQGYNWEPIPGHEAVLNAELAPLVIAPELPPQPEALIVFDKFSLPAEAQRHYDDMHRKLFAGLGEDGVLAGSAAIATGKLAQLANGFIYDDGVTVEHVHEEKRQWLEDVVADAVGPLLIIYEYREDLLMIKDVVGEDMPYLGAGVSDLKAQKNIEAWNRGELPFMGLHPASGGHGLNLQHGGSDMAWICPCWSAEFWEQTIARLNRSGQTRQVVVRVCVARGTVDEVKIDRVHHKMTAQAAFENYLRRHRQARAA